MAAKVTIGGDGTLFVGTDMDLELEVTDRNGIPVDISGWGIRFVVKSPKNEQLIDQTASITGVYSSTLADNTQRALVQLTGTELDIDADVHQHSWKRTDSGSRRVIARGDFIVEATTQ